jgi:hypothetical protein
MKKIKKSNHVGKLIKMEFVLLVIYSNGNTD